MSASAPTPLSALVACWQEVRARPGKLDKRRRLSALFSTLEAEDLRLAALYLSGDLGREAPGVGWALFHQALDTAGVATPPVTLAEVDEAVVALRGATGPGSVRRRLEILTSILSRADPAGREFLAGLFLGELRQGALKAIVVEALAEALGLDLGTLRRAVMMAGGLGEVTVAARREGEVGLARFTLTPLTPVEPMLACTAEDLEATLAELGGEAAAEWKLDGVRVQLHRQGDEVRVFTRALRDVTSGSPELVALARALPTSGVVLDGEMIAHDHAERPLPFQDLMSRFSREDGGRPAPLEVRFFDVLYADGEPLVDRPDRERRAVLERILPPALVIPRRIVRTAGEARATLEEALGQGHEGILLKALDASYAAGRRGANWRKVKPAVTLDLVILAAEWGHGRRRGLLSNLHLGARDAADPARFWMLGKTFKGLTDAMLRQLTEELPAIATSQDAYVVRVRPERVVEIAFDAVQRSQRYDSGLALRFARVKRFRPDKRPEDATTVDEIRMLAG